MAEKPRLKKSDEILGSIAAESVRSTRGSGGLSRRAGMESGQERNEKTPEPYTPGDAPEEENFDAEEPLLPSAQSLAEKLMTRENGRRRLNFEKYGLPQKSTPETAAAGIEIPAATAMPEEAAFQTAVDIPTAPRPQEAETAMEIPAGAPKSFAPPRSTIRKAAHQAAPPSVLAESPPASASVVTEYTFESFEPPDTPEEPSPAPSRRSLRERARRRAPSRKGTEDPPEPVPQPGSPAPKGDAPEFLQEPWDREEPLPGPVQSPAQKAAEPVPERDREGARAPAETTEERRRREFLERITNQFEQQFDERFGSGALNPRDSLRQPVPPPVPREPVFAESAMGVASFDAPKSQGTPATSSVEDFYTALRQGGEDGRREPEQDDAESGARDFLSKFMQDVEQEEEKRSEDFKETLAEKFMRERERYLKDLGISIKEQETGPEPGAHPTGAQRRKLDFQIQPEMHMRAGDAPLPRPQQANVTYNRGGMVIKPQPDTENEVPAQKLNPVPVKKTGEQLLMEHGHLAKAPRKPEFPKKGVPLKFTFETPEEQAKRQKERTRRKKLENILPKEKWPRRIVFISMACGLAAVALLVLPFLQYLNLTKDLAADPALTAASPSALEQDTLEVYETRSFEQTAKVHNIIFKNADVALKNVEVQEYVVIENIRQSGKIRLEDIRVNSAISLKSGGVHALELHNVKAKRVIIDNPDTDVTVSASGNSDIEAVEIRTPSSVRQLEMERDALGIRDLVIASDSGLNAKLDGLKLANLQADARETILTFENGTQAEAMSCAGSLSLSGEGKVTNLAIGAKSGQGAGDAAAPKAVSLIIKGVDIVNLNVKGPISANLSTHVEALATSNDIAIDGAGGSIAAFTINPGKPLTRVIADLSGVSINSAYTNTAARLNIAETANVNALIANQSTFVLGKKVNHLIANAGDIVYDLKPDSLTVADGVPEPIDRADNPAYDLNAMPGETAKENAESSGSDTEPGVTTTCGHPAEAGGFTRGDGSKDSPFEVSTPLQLAHVSEHLNAFFLQTNNINLADDAALGEDFPMIGTDAEPFTGVYDGAGYSVSGLNISSANENVGLFAANSGVIQNLWLMSGTLSSTATSRAFIGGIAGINLEGGAIRACSNGATIFGNANTYTGGIAGYNFGARILDCFNYGNISGVDNVGGIAGRNRMSATIAGSYNAGAIEGRDMTGAVSGQNEDAIITNCYYLETSWSTGIGEGNGTATPKTESELASADMALELSAGNENTIWFSGQPASNGYRYPMHKKPE